MAMHDSTAGPCPLNLAVLSLLSRVEDVSRFSLVIPRADLAYYVFPAKTRNTSLRWHTTGVNPMVTYSYYSLFLLDCIYIQCVLFASCIALVCLNLCDSPCSAFFNHYFTDTFVYKFILCSLICRVVIVELLHPEIHCWSFCWRNNIHCGM